MSQDNACSPMVADARPVTVCVDAAGGEAPASVILEGVAAALDADPALSVILVGPAEDIEPFAEMHAPRCTAVPSTQVISMDEAPAEAVRAKRDSSIVVGCRQVREGRADGFFSAGSTGAVMAAATLGIGRIKGVDRPALTIIVPGSTPTVLLDLGANADCKPLNLVQFAQMGSAYARVALGIEEPRVGLLNIGSEDGKGSQIVRSYHDALRELPSFTGNAESSDLFNDRFDVVAADGFTGNIALKSIEATASFLMGRIKASIADGGLSAKLGGALLLPSLRNLKKLLSGDAHGGAVLLGVRGVVAIGHGSTSADAVMHGTQAVANAVRKGLVDQVASLCSDASA